MSLKAVASEYTLPLNEMRGRRTAGAPDSVRSAPRGCTRDTVGTAPDVLEKRSACAPPIARMRETSKSFRGFKSDLPVWHATASQNKGDITECTYLLLRLRNSL